MTTAPSLDRESRHLGAWPRARHRQVDGAQALDLRAHVGEAGWHRLPAAVQRRFGPHAAPVTYRGEMSLSCSRIGTVFALLSRLVGGPLTTLRAEHRAADVRVAPDGRGGVVWERLLRGDDGRAAVVRSTKRLDADGSGGLMELTDGGLSMSLDAFEEAGQLVFRSRRYRFVRGGLRVRVPAWLSPGTCRVEHEDLGRGRFRFSLSMTHPWWGTTFRQEGVFVDPLDEATSERDQPEA